MSRIYLSLLCALGPALCLAEDYDPNPNEYMDSLFNELEGLAGGGQAGQLLGLGLNLIKTGQRVTYEKEAVMGETISLQAFARYGRLSSDPTLLQYVSLVGNAVARASFRPNTPYYFAICQNRNPNAFAVPGGYIFITTGLLNLMKNEEELAGVLGHEIAHVALQHAIKSIRASKQTANVLGGLDALLGERPANPKQPKKRPDYFALVGSIAKTITEKGFPFKQEVQADEFGTEFAYRAGYRVQGLRDFLTTLSQMEKSREDFALFKTHRDHGKRVYALDKLIKKKGYPDIPINPRLAARFKANLTDRKELKEVRGK